MRDFSALVVASIICFSTPQVYAQIMERADQKQDAGLEDLYDKFEDQEVQQREKTKKIDKARESSDEEKEKELTRLAELAELAPFDDIAVIQKRYLPKTSRFEFSGNAALSTNNQYFNNLGPNVRGAFYFTETMGLELMYQKLFSSKRAITEGLVDNQRISTRSLVEPESFMGLLFKWSPIYGKMALFHESIIPFDIYFTPGLGISKTKEGNFTTLSLGAGQLFAISKMWAVRWDFTWNYYKADVVIVDDSATYSDTRQQSDLFIGIGISMFIPEAKYR